MNLIDHTYIYIYIYIIYISFMYIFLKNRKLDFLLGVSIFFILILVSSIRESGGTDLKSYLSLWNAIKPLTSETSIGNYNYFEIGFRFLLSLFKYISDSEYFYKFSISFIIFLTLFFSLIKNRGSLTIGFLIFYLIYFVSYNLNAVGQGIAMVYFTLILPILYKSSKVKYVISAFPLFFIHKSMLLSLLIFPGKDREFKIFSYFIIIFSLILFVYTGVLNDFLKNIFYNFININHSIFNDAISSIDIAQRIILLLFMYILCFKIYRNKYNCFLFRIYAYSFMIYFIFSSMPVTATRIHMFFRIIEVIIIARTFGFPISFEKRLFVLISSIILYSPGYYIQITHPNSFLGI